MQFSEKIDGFVDDCIRNEMSSLDSIAPLINHSPWQCDSELRKCPDPKGLHERIDRRQLNEMDLRLLQILYPEEDAQQILNQLLSLCQEEGLQKKSEDSVIQGENDLLLKKQKKLKEPTSEFHNELNPKAQTSCEKVIEEKDLKTNSCSSHRKAVKKTTLCDRIASEEEPESKPSNSPKNVKFAEQPSSQRADFTDCLNSAAQSREKTLQPLESIQKLKEECYAALGRKIVEKQTRTAEVELENVNYYTRQYVMPVIQDSLRQLQAQNEAKLSIQDRQKYIRGILSGDKSKSSYFERSTYRVYVPANSKGQCFDSDFKPDPVLYSRISEAEYLRVIRQVNEIIQKVLTRHRHQTFLKRKRTPLPLEFSNILTVGLIALSLILMTIKLLLRDTFNAGPCKQPIISEFETCVFILVFLALIMMLGNAFRGFRVEVKKSSLIKQISRDIRQYFGLLNSRNKKEQWILGTDFFWIEIHLKGFVHSRM